MALALGDRSVRLWDTLMSEPVASLDGHTDEVESVSFHPSGRTLVSGSRDGTVKVWETDSRLERQILVGHQGAVQAVAVHPAGSMVASGGADGTLRLWQLFG